MTYFGGPGCTAVGAAGASDRRGSGVERGNVETLPLERRCSEASLKQRLSSRKTLY